MSFVTELPPVVVDASVSVALLAEERADVERHWSGWSQDGRMLLAPAMHWSEVGNILLKRKRMTPAQGAVLMGGLQRAGLEIADRGLPGVCFALELAARHRLSVYDATYLWLAIDIDGELATLDADLARAAEAEGVPLALPLWEPS